MLADTAESQVITIENAAKSLRAELTSLLNSEKVGKDGIDEHKAKVLRKSWDTLQSDAGEVAFDVSELEQDFEKLRTRIHLQVDARNKRYAELEVLLEKLKREVKLGDLKTSQQLEQKIINGLNKISGLSSQRRQKVIGELEQLEPKLKKLASWRHWGTDQARQKVIDEIKSLHDNEKDLEKVAQRIKQARDEWKEWDNSGEGGDKKLYKEFDNACSKAYEPCKKLFDAQRKQRAAASKERTKLVEMLETDYEKADWRNPDWKQLQQTLREQSNRWRKLGAAEFRDRKPLQKRYDSIIEKFEGPLSRERKRNLKAREDVIEAVRTLAQMDDNRKAISELQSLKKQWVVTVSGKRKLEQVVWKKFTEACDVVYESGRQAKKSFDQELAQNLKAKEALCVDIEVLSKENNVDADVLSAGLKKWASAWAEAGKVPKAAIKQIDNRYRNAITVVNKELKKLRQQNKTLVDNRFFAAAAFCADIEQQLQNDTVIDADQMASNWSEFESLDKARLDLIDARYKLVVAAIDNQAKKQKLIASADSHFEAINGYLVQLEINAGIDSPAAYGKQRMALQIGRLSAAMGKAAAQEILDSEQLVTRIHITGIVSPAQQQEINQRFNKCYEAL